MVIFRGVLIIFIGIFILIGQVSAQENYYRNFWSPKYHGQRLNYCSFDGKLCGIDLATCYCKKLGYKKADKAIIAHNVGLTNFLTTKGGCKGWQCSGFKLIQCVDHTSNKPAKIYSYRYRRFDYPRFNHYRVDWCYENGKGCGQQAAYSYCRRLGYLKSSGYKKQERVASTKALGNQKLCFGQQCSGFSEITCYR